MANVAARFSERVRSRRHAKELTQGRLAELVCVTQPTISAWESGSAFPSPASLLRLAGVLDEDAGALLALMVSEAELASAS